MSLSASMEYRCLPSREAGGSERTARAGIPVRRAAPPWAGQLASARWGCCRLACGIVAAPAFDRMPGLPAFQEGLELGLPEA